MELFSRTKDEDFNKDYINFVCDNKIIVKSKITPDGKVSGICNSKPATANRRSV